MKKVTHTAGPWHTDPEFDNAVVLGADGLMVADCNIFGLAAIRNRTTKSCQANAKLIAAAPEMYFALKEIAEGFGGASLRPQDHQENCMNSIKELAAAIIAEIEGGDA